MTSLKRILHITIVAIGACDIVYRSTATATNEGRRCLQFTTSTTAFSTSTRTLSSRVRQRAEEDPTLKNSNFKLSEARSMRRTRMYMTQSSSDSGRSSSRNTNGVPLNGVGMVAVREASSKNIRRKGNSTAAATTADGDYDEDGCLVDPPSKHVARERQPPFPSSAYSNMKEKEKEFTHNYISFIDQSLMKAYSQETRLIEPRRYALPDQFEKRNAKIDPTIDDVAMPRTNYGPVAALFAWNGLPARAVVASASYLCFPFIIQFLDVAINNDGNEFSVDMLELSKLVDSFLPGVAIVLGTYFSLTISILYDRLTKLTEAVNLECSQLALTLINLLHLFEDSDPEAAVEGAQCVADQVRVLVYDNRGRETIGVVYSDPYARLLRLLKDYTNTDACTSLVDDAYLLADLHGNVGRLFQLRTERLTIESLALAPTHFDVMTFLSGLLLAGFALGTLATASEAGVPTETARVLFAGLVVCYTVFYEMAFDLNRPFDGIYQLRRSGAAMHLLQIKQIVTTHPVVRDRVDFDAIEDEEEESMGCDGDCQQRKARIWYN